ncbi:Lysophospholipase VolA (Vibrio outer membrane lysophospholipase A), partial [Durusdinium trenchii]
AAAGLEQGDADLETFFNVFQAALDSADPINFADSLNQSGSKVLLSQVNGDQVIPNDALENPLGDAFDAYLSGTEPFAELLNAVAVTNANEVDLGITDGPLTGATGVPLANAAITRYTEGTHGTPVLPQGGPLDVRVFGEMVRQTATVNATGGAAVILNFMDQDPDITEIAVVDLLNVRASLGGLDFDGTEGADLDSSSVYFVGHSLGTIVGAPFVAVANESSNAADDIVAAQLLTPGAGIVRLLENSPAFAPSILGGLQAAAGLEQGDADLETFFNVFQAALDSADPINFADSLNQSGSKVLLSQVNGDQVIPNDALENPLGDAFDAYLSGTEPFAELLNAVAVTNANEVDLGITDGPLTGATGVPLANAAITRYTEGTHGTPVLPQGGPLDVRVFGEMVRQTATVNATGGAAVILNFMDQDPDITEIVQQD